jgi:RHS repeat-associated protein
LRRSATEETSLYIDGLTLDNHLGAMSPAGARYSASSALGTVMHETDGAANILVNRTYDSFGQLTTSAAEGFSFTGREWDADAELYYYRARYYSPALARFLSEDPIGLRGGSNRYSYVLNNPIKYGDPTGLMVYECHRPLGSSMGKVGPHGLLWSTECEKSYSFGPSYPSPIWLGRIVWADFSVLMRRKR